MALNFWLYLAYSSPGENTLDEVHSNKKTKSQSPGIETTSQQYLITQRLLSTSYIYVRTVILPPQTGLIMFGHSIWPEPEILPRRAIMFGPDPESGLGPFFFRNMLGPASGFLTYNWGSFEAPAVLYY